MTRVSAEPTAAPSRSELDWQARTALVTGGGSGLGAAICRELSAAGARVVVADVMPEAARAVAAELEPERSIDLELDVTDRASIDDGLATVLARFPVPNVVVNNAGIDRTDPFEEIPAAVWDRVLDVNLRGPANVSRAVWPLMHDAGGGAIVNIVSTAATRAWANASAYHASKWGLLGLSRALHVEGRAAGISVSALIAGGMRTPFLLERFPDLDLGVLQPPESVAKVVRLILEMPAGSTIPEVMVLPTAETSWP